MAGGGFPSVAAGAALAGAYVSQSKAAPKKQFPRIWVKGTKKLDHGLHDFVCEIMLPVHLDRWIGGDEANVFGSLENLLSGVSFDDAESDPVAAFGRAPLVSLPHLPLRHPWNKASPWVSTKSFELAPGRGRPPL